MMLSSHHRYGWHSIGKIAIVGVCAWALSMVPGFTASPSTGETYHYREVTGATVKVASWQLVKGDTWILTYSTPTARHITTTGPDYDTIDWRLTDDDGLSDLYAERRGDVIAVRGRFRGQPVAKRLEIDDAPWYQATSLSLRSLVASNDTERVFWTIRPSTMTAHRVRAIKKRVEIIDIAGPPRELLRIHMTLPGILAPFWKSDCWFSMPEGVLMRFEGPSGPPGSPTTVVTRIES
jgi:hypothetical protein